MKKKSIKLNFVNEYNSDNVFFHFSIDNFSVCIKSLLPVGTGKVSMATSVITYFSMFAQLGIPTYGFGRVQKLGIIVRNFPRWHRNF